MASIDFPSEDIEIEKCRDFLSTFPSATIQLQDIANRQLKTLEIHLDDVLHHKGDQEFIANIQKNTQRYITYFEQAADNLLPAMNTNVEQNDFFDILESQRRQQFATGNGSPEDETEKIKIRRFEVQFYPSSDEKLRNLRDIHASDIGGLIRIKGMVVRVTDVKPCVTMSTYTCEVCGGEIFQPVTGNQFMPLSKCPSQRCIDNNTAGKLTMLTRGSVFTKYQELKLQEPPDQVPIGNIPRSINIRCWGEQTRCCIPGDTVIVSGIFLSIRLSGYKAMKTGLQTDTYVKASRIEKVRMGQLEFETISDLSSHEIVREIALETDTYRHLACSIAPEIFGHEDVKKALLLQLVGADTKVLEDGMRIRGDINICLMGDPGVAKSQLLKHIAGMSPRGVYTTGKGSSGVGLTAAVVRDETTGEMALEGGALVLADCGICCIDEFDKMDENDRTAIHEVMEQQTISIAKAGITTTLNARSAVLAAANPLYGRYNKRKSISENVDLPNSLLSRFDLLFLLLDKAESEQDINLARHILHVHKFSKNRENVFKPFPRSSMIKYINLAKTIRPRVPPDLTSYIVEAYTSLRLQSTEAQSLGPSNSRQSDQMTMTARQLLSILRLSQALARLRLSNVISTEDIDESIRLIHASKASILTNDVQQSEDPISSIFNSIKSLFESQRVCSIPYSVVEASILKKGFTTEQLGACLQDYEQLGVINVSDNQIHFEVY